VSDKLPFNPIPVEPSLMDLLQLFKQQILLQLFKIHIGIVQAFDPDEQTVTVKIAYSKTYFQFDAKTKQYVPKQVDYPIILQAPAIVLGGGDGALTFGISQGDECLVLFNDRDIDNWFAGGAGSPCKTTRLHSFADGLALVGIRSLGRVLEDYDITRASVRKGTTRVGVGASKVLIENESTTLLTLLDQLIDVIKGLVTVGSSTTQTISPASQLLLENMKTTLGGLLE
jgi:hypothetical protein